MTSRAARGHQRVDGSGALASVLAVVENSHNIKLDTAQKVRKDTVAGVELVHSVGCFRHARRERRLSGDGPGQARRKHGNEDLGIHGSEFLEDDEGLGTPASIEKQDQGSLNRSAGIQIGNAMTAGYLKCRCRVGDMAGAFVGPCSLRLAGS